MSQNTEKYTALAKPYKRKIGDVIFIVSSFGNQNTSVNAEDMLLDMIKNKILYENQKLLDMIKNKILYENQNEEITAL